ncbi:MAG: hypothetical protein AAFY71_03210 [Bacteroidota bacterium]
MQRVLIFISLLLSLSVSFAQRVDSPRSRSASDMGGYSALELNQKQVEKEAELSQLLERYQSARNPSREALKARMMTVIYELFDLSMMQKASEANSLRLTLQSLSSRTDYNKNQEILKLKKELEMVERQLEQRLNLRDKIVAKRLYDMTN